MKKRAVIIAGIVICLSIAGVFLFIRLQRPTLQIPPTFSSIQEFTPYYTTNSSVQGFELSPESVSYESGILIFSMKNHKSNKTLAFTEQKLPAGYDIDALQGDKEFKTQYGRAFITDQNNRTTGTLFTDDHTWILINAPSPIGADDMQQILNHLAPVR